MNTHAQFDFNDRSNGIFIDGYKDRDGLPVADTFAYRLKAYLHGDDAAKWTKEQTAALVAKYSSIQMELIMKQNRTEFVLPFGLTIALEKQRAGGERLVWIDKSGSGLLEQFSDGEPDVAARAAADAMESLVLALASAGVDVASPSFIQGFGVAVESVAQRLDDYPDVGHIQKPR